MSSLNFFITPRNFVDLDKLIINIQFYSIFCLELIKYFITKYEDLVEYFLLYEMS